MNENIITENIRKNPFCVISKATCGDYAVHDIQTNSAWTGNPYGSDYAVVPDDLVEGILATRGFCFFDLNEDGTEVVSFTPMEIPEIPEPEAAPNDLELLRQENETLRTELLNTQLAVAELAEMVAGGM